MDTVHPLVAMRDRFRGFCHKVEFAVAFECGGCCKKATDIGDIDVEDGFLILTPAECELITVTTVSSGRIVDKQKAIALVVPVDRVCAIEAESPECRCKDE